ncbi:aldehyde dehydrogenase family protein [Peribacillus sp. NPDC096540]|uniref:aldehyde dehydrogenase family protein n=1 Tax=Peribacillus sp. NPDC096540 TaxID=3390612 RepID=UPI003CFFB37E
MADEAYVKKALEGAQAAYETMKEMPSYKRSETLFDVVQTHHERREELAHVLGT